jgi:F0F1-type ATP synthase assembly protein I
MLQSTLDKSIAIIQVCAVAAALVAGILIGMLIHIL